jgi:hypothetical protein
MQQAISFPDMGRDSDNNMGMLLENHSSVRGIATG